MVPYVFVNVSCGSSVTAREPFQIPVVYWTFTRVGQKSQLSDEVLHFHICLPAMPVLLFGFIALTHLPSLNQIF